MTYGLGFYVKNRTIVGAALCRGCLTTSKMVQVAEACIEDDGNVHTFVDTCRLPRP